MQLSLLKVFGTEAITIAVFVDPLRQRHTTGWPSVVWTLKLRHGKHNDLYAAFPQGFSYAWRLSSTLPSKATPPEPSQYLKHSF